MRVHRASRALAGAIAVGTVLVATTCGRDAIGPERPGPATKLAFTVPPSAATAGVAITPPVRVTVQDAQGNTVTGSTASITLAITSGTGTTGAVLRGTLTQAAVAGVATFSDLTVDEAAAGYTMTATASSLTSATSTAFVVSPGAATTLAFTAQPGNVAAGTAITPAVQVTVQDAQGNTVTGSTASVVLAITSGTGRAGAHLQGTATVAAVSGVAIFSTLSIDSAGSGYTLTATATGLTSAFSAAFTVSPGAATQLAFAVQPSDVGAGAAISPAVRVAVQDAQGNTVTTASGTVTLALTTPGGATLEGGGPMSVADGVATFSGLRVNRVGTYTLTPTTTVSSVATRPASTGFTVSAGTTRRLVFTVQPCDLAAGATIDPAVQVAIQDLQGNTVAGATDSVSLAITSGTGTSGAVLGGTGTVAAVSGVATFGTLTVDKAGLGYTLTASAASVFSDTSDAFSVNPTTGVRLLVTSPRPASRWYVITDGGALTSPQVDTYPGQYRRTDELLVSLPAGTGYRVRLLVADSASSEFIPVPPPPTASGLVTGVDVVAGFLTTQSVTATAVSAVVTIPDPVTGGASFPVEATLSDESQVLSATPRQCAMFWYGTDYFVEDNRGGAGSELCTWSKPSATTIRFTGSASGPSSAGTMFSQVCVYASVGTQQFMYCTPSMVLGQYLRATTVTRPYSMAVNAGNDQSATAGSPVAAAPSVKVTDSSGGAVPGVTVHFAIAAGGGLVTGATQVTDGSGIATVGSWILGTTPGPNTLTATAFGLTGSPVSFNATGTGTAPGPNLWIDGLHLTQATQTYQNSVPLVAHRSALVRVFVKADLARAMSPSVRVRLYQNATLVNTYTIRAPTSPVPTTIDEGVLDASWNVTIPAEVVRSGLSILADVDPTNAIPESNEDDNSFPGSGTPMALDVRTVSPFSVTLVPVVQSPNGLQGDVSEGNKDTYLDFANRVYPLSAYDASVHLPYVFSGVPTDGSTWSDLLGEILAVRAAEGSHRYYYGVIRYTSGFVAGMALLGGYVAAGEDASTGDSDYAVRAKVSAHEWGHNFGRLHVDCGGPSNTDVNYPYSAGGIGVYGYDLARTVLYGPPLYKDLMSYCGPEWISDYTYKGVLDYRAALPAQTPTWASRRSLLVWGRIGPDTATLEPAFEIDAPPSLPTQTGPYRVVATDDTGREVFNIAFAGEAVAEAPDERHFAFAVPLPSDGSRPLVLRLLADGGESLRRSSALMLAAGDSAAIQAAVRLRPSAGTRSRLEWDAARYPMALVRDPATGQVRSFARGGHVEIPVPGRNLDVVLSDGVRSVRRLVPLSRP